MAEQFLLREILRRWRPASAARITPIVRYRYFYSTAADVEDSKTEKRTNNQWFILPSFAPSADGSAIGKRLAGRPSETKEGAMTALKWILNCCPHLPRSLVQKLFRLRQVRKECSGIESEQLRPRRVKQIFLPKSVDGNCPSTAAEDHSLCNEDELKFVRGLELYKDPAIIVINKPPGMPVQGGIGIKRSLDELAAKYLKYDLKESPRLVHRLDRDSSGILVMGRTQLSATVLHSIFREKTFGASDDNRDSKRSLEKRYWALVVGSPRRPKGLISVPLVKVVVDNGKSERITVVDNIHNTSAQHAVTGYRVIATSSGYTWLELSPLTGRKHQLRVHCAEVLGTPIVGDYKYGWQAHKKIGHLLGTISDLKPYEQMSKLKHDTFGFELESGSISDKQFRLHLHCKEMVLPNISLALQHGVTVSDMDAALIESITVDAPLPAHMRRSWDLLK
ncbi:hypothetical protein RD792_016204 [Penstemon davidsonii]|uniref:Pseudouridine synthase RsuA/RluA-like domain-containing protein n=1 Tax=Penstemon davidsonii TaxID=160366 RepID=A0ABR0CJI3_9LAMI|nr:hypothetical protein RD792_016204 [Penstemon davidsonii]